MYLNIASETVLFAGEKQCFKEKMIFNPLKRRSGRLLESMPQAEGEDLLLDLLQGQLVVILHPEILLELLILFGGNVYRAIVVIGQTTNGPGGHPAYLF